LQIDFDFAFERVYVAVIACAIAIAIESDIDSFITHVNAYVHVCALRNSNKINARVRVNVIVHVNAKTFGIRSRGDIDGDGRDLRLNLPNRSLCKHRVMKYSNDSRACVHASASRRVVCSWIGSTGLGKPKTPGDALQGRNTADREGHCTPLPKISEFLSKEVGWETGGGWLMPESAMQAMRTCMKQMNRIK
jgi:hypothetical protein